ncbi:MAG: VWA domain-containing protein, partial [Candidatus Aenigmatarchaeota archaeon]
MRKKYDNLIKELLMEKGWDITYNLSIEYSPVNSLICGCIDNYDWKIQLTINPQLDEKINEICEKEKLNIKLPTKKIIQFVVEHEYGHWEYCPRDIMLVESILDGTSIGLKKANFREEEIEEYTLHVANLYMDILVNTIHSLGKEKKEFQDGMLLFYIAQAYTNKKKYPDWYGIFVDVQMKLLDLVYGKKTVGNLVERFVDNYDLIRGVAKEIIEILTNKEISEKIYNNRREEINIKEIVKNLKDFSSWKEKAELFASIIGKYLKDKLKDLESRTQLPYFLDKMKKDENFRRQIIRGGIKKGSKLYYANKVEVFDEIYKNIASEIVIKITQNQKEEISEPSPYYIRKEKVKENFELKNIYWPKTLFIEKIGREEEIWFYKKCDPLREVPNKRRVSKKEERLKDILFIVDTSDSMGWSRNPLDGSKYDITLRAIYGIIEYLEKNNLSTLLHYGLIIFGGSTIWSGWKKYNQLNELKKMLFLNYSGGYTFLDANIIEEAVSSSPNKFLALMISDGEINVDR